MEYVILVLKAVLTGFLVAVPLIVLLYARLTGGKPPVVFLNYFFGCRVQLQCATIVSQAFPLLQNALLVLRDRAARQLDGLFVLCLVEHTVDMELRVAVYVLRQLRRRNPVARIIEVVVDALLLDHGSD